jgi:hypothetical protein
VTGEADRRPDIAVGARRDPRRRPGRCEDRFPLGARGAVAGTAPIAIGADVDGVLHPFFAGVLLLIADPLYLSARSAWRSPQRPAR